MKNSGQLIRGAAPLNTGKLISAYYLEVEYLLARIEGANTHYQTLGVERSADNEEVIRAYQQAVTVLHPNYHKVRAAVPDEMLVRVDQAFKKVSQAFSILTSSKEREQYDNQCRSPRSYATRPLDLPKLEPAARAGAPRPQETEQKSADVSAETIHINSSPEMRPLFTKAAPRDATLECRRSERFKLSVPVLIAGYDRTGGKWQEVTKTIDVSRIGVGLRMRKRLRHGLVVHITLPLPTKLRSHGFSEAGYNMYAIVRRVEALKDGTREVGFEFIGANPPTDYLHKPWATFRTPRWNGSDRRREPRERRAEPVAVEYFDEAMQLIGREGGVTEDVSASGVRVCVKAAPPEFEFVRVTSAKHNFDSLAQLRNQWSGTDGSERLCLRFVDQMWPM
jgi:hypothetical protein